MAITTLSRDRSDTEPVVKPSMIAVRDLTLGYGGRPVLRDVNLEIEAGEFLQRGQVPIPFSANRSHYLSNLEGVVSDPLTQTDMREISTIDRYNRLIKGQVFLWKEGQSWEDLWDVNGEITPS